MILVRATEHNGRLRKYYHITKKGLDRINEFEKEWQEIYGIYQFIVKEGIDNDKE